MGVNKGDTRSLAYGSSCQKFKPLAYVTFSYISPNRSDRGPYIRAFFNRCQGPTQLVRNLKTFPPFKPSG